MATDWVSKAFTFITRSLKLFDPNIQEIGKGINFEDISNPALESYIGNEAATLRDDLELVEGIYPEFSRSDYLEGNLAPVFFGSALYNFGVQELLHAFLEIAPPPQPSLAEEREIQPEEPGFTGFIFKIHANIDPTTAVG